jgi:hypothetical protein
MAAQAIGFWRPLQSDFERGGRAGLIAVFHVLELQEQAFQI